MYANFETARWDKCEFLEIFISQCCECGGELGGLRAVAEGWDFLLQIGVQRQAVATHDEQITSPCAFARRQEPCIKICREKLDIGKLRPQCLQNEECVIHVASDNADRFDASALLTV